MMPRHLVRDAARWRPLVRIRQTRAERARSGDRKGVGTGELHASLLADGGHSDLASIEAATALGVVPVISPRSEKTPDNHRESDVVTAWRERMTQPASKRLLRARASLCELPNAHAKTRFAMASALVRGLEKVTCIALLVALTSNLVAHGARLLA